MAPAFLPVTLLCGGMALLAPAAAGPAWAQGSTPRPSAEEADARAAIKAAEKARREDALRQAERRIGESGDRKRRLAGEIAELRSDGARLAAALVAAGALIQSAEARVRTLEDRLDLLGDSEAAVRASLERRRDLTAEVLAALQRMNRNQAPAILVRADDIVAAIRSALMLGSVVPGLREEVDALSADLVELGRLRDLTARDRSALDAELLTLAGERDRLAALTAERRDQLVQAETDLGREKARSDVLGQETRSLKELVDRLDGEIGLERRNADLARRQVQAEIKDYRDRLAAASAREPVRLQPRVAFADAQGLLGRPVAGPTSRGFGEPDGQGGTLRGIVIAARPKALVTAPAEGWVAYAGPFRSFGRLLIINAGGGYYLLLAGMGQISVEPGQFVLAGEPVGQMGDTAQPSAAMSAVETGGSGLYVEFRKDGGPIDPGPWWSKSQGEKVRG